MLLLEFTWLAAVAALQSCAAVPPTETAPGPATRPAATAPAREGVAALLDRLERSAADLRDFQAEITYWKWDSMLERRETRVGEVVYIDDAGSKRFAILLRTQIIGDRKRDVHKDYVFDGSWLAEVDHRDRLFIKRQIVPPGETFDPLKLGEGPFPLPLGQPKQEVLARFDVELVAAPGDDLLLGVLGDRAVEGLRLVPKPGTPQAEEISHVELFYDAATLLPVGIGLTEIDGDRKTVYLRNARRNAGVDESLLDIDEPDPKQWRIDVQPWEG